MTDTVADRAALVLFWRAYRAILHSYQHELTATLVLVPTTVVEAAETAALDAGLTAISATTLFTAFAAPGAEETLCVVRVPAPMGILVAHGAVSRLLALMPDAEFVPFAQHALRHDGECLCITPIRS